MRCGMVTGWRMKHNDFKRLVMQEMANGAVRFKVVCIDKEISLCWTNAQGFLCNSILYTVKRSRMSQCERRRLQMYRLWLKNEIP